MKLAYFMTVIDDGVLHGMCVL